MHQQGDDIGVFLAVCTEGSFVAASARLHLSPSAVAKAVARIESRLGVRLFRRTTRTTSLTSEGMAYRTVCIETRRDLKRVETALRALSVEPAGRLKVSLPPVLGTKVIAPALYDLCRQWPALDMDISTSVTAIDLVNAGFDLAVRVGELPDTTSLTAKLLGTQTIVLCASPSYIDRHGLPVEIEDLSRHALIAQSASGEVRPWLFNRTDGGITSLRPKARVLLEGSLLAFSAVQQGLGIGFLPRWLAHDELESGALIPILDDQITGHLPVHAIWPASPVMIRSLRATIDTIVTAAGSILD